MSPPLLKGDPRLCTWIPWGLGPREHVQGQAPRSLHDNKEALWPPDLLCLGHSDDRAREAQELTVRATPWVGKGL